MTQTLHNFFEDCKFDGITNNASAKDMKFNSFPMQTWWGVVDKDRLISISGCYLSDDFGPQSWRLLFRSATLKAYRSLAGPFSKDLSHDFCWGTLLEHQKTFAYSQGAKRLFFTTNSDSDGYVGSRRVNRFVKNVLAPRGKVDLLHKDLEYYNCRQNIWEIL